MAVRSECFGKITLNVIIIPMPGYFELVYVSGNDFWFKK